MPLSLVLLIRVVANPFSNVFQKLLTRRGASASCIIFLTFALLTVVAAPILPVIGTKLTAGFWANIVVCALLAVAGNVALVEALRTADLSVLGPINAYKSVVSLLPAIIFLHELPSLMQLVGITLIVAGSFLVVESGTGVGRRPRRLAFSEFWLSRGIRYRFLALAFSATEAVFLKRAIRSSSPLVTFVYWVLLGCAVSMIYVVLITPRGRLRGELIQLHAEPGLFIALAATTALMQLTTLFAFEAFAVGPALALFQMSAVVTVILGNRVFQEGAFLRRLIGCLIMIAGAVQILLQRSHG